jgi:formate-nitrite transporter family protein
MAPWSRSCPRRPAGTQLHFQGTPMRDHHEPSQDGAPDLAPHELKKAHEEESLDADTTYEVVRREGEKELSRTTSALAWSGLAAGLSMGFSMVGEGLLHRYLPAAEWRPLVSKLGYSFGFLIVILGSQQLFTENTLTPIVPLLARRTRELARNVIRLWGAVLVTNLVGAFAFAWVTARSAVFDVETRHAFREVALRAVEPAFGTVLLKGIFAGWLVALLVWMLPASQTAHFWVILVIAWLIGIGHLSHVIAGSVEVFYLVARNDLGFLESLGRFVIPALIGNVIGGVSLVASLNHAQVKAGSS